MLHLRLRHAGPIALLTLGVVATPALAHSGSNAVATVKGTITSLNRSSLRIQTMTSAVSAQIGSSTHVIRVVAGSTADIRSGANVELVLVRGTTTVSSITILATRQSNRDLVTSESAEPTRSSSSLAAHSTRIDQHPEGQVVSINANSITLRGHHGQTATYTLGSNPTVNKLMTGHVSDLQLGESVRAQLRSRMAVSITILSS